MVPLGLALASCREQALFGDVGGAVLWGGAGTSDPRPGSVLLLRGSREWNLGYSQLLALLWRGDACGARRERGLLGGSS